jgi:hypothetical protein
MKKSMKVSLALVAVILLVLSPYIALEFHHRKKIKTVLSLSSEFMCGLVDKDEPSTESVFKDTELSIKGSSFGARRDISELTLKNRYFSNLLAEENSMNLLNFFSTHEGLKTEESYPVFSWKNELIQRLWLMDKFNLYCRKTERTPFDWGSNEFLIRKES